MDSRTSGSRYFQEIVVDRHEGLLCGWINERSCSTRRTEVRRARRVEDGTRGTTVGPIRTNAPECRLELRSWRS
eukprot:4939681-Pyramimonas_sp.AAC.1